ncbi:hypothetical protein GCM10009760_39880 [Kitasatospora kazusensis]|uniref:Uncharacterized protein n=1 Tax=Kitasatospora kazusensis TaxID=407974 RepID=A0ABN2ZV24_9ACTN
MRIVCRYAPAGFLMISGTGLVKRIEMLSADRGVNLIRAARVSRSGPACKPFAHHAAARRALLHGCSAAGLPLLHPWSDQWRS